MLLADRLREGLDIDAPAPLDITDLGRACQTLNGKFFWPLTPNHPSNRYDIAHIGHSLAVQARWGGWTADRNGDPIRYSVAQHAVHVSDLANMGRWIIMPEIDWDIEGSPADHGLGHDNTEAYLVDLPRPVKGELGDYYSIEAALDVRIHSEFQIATSPAIIKTVKWVDNAILFWERDALMGRPEVPYVNEHQHPGGTIYDVIPEFRVWSAKEAKQRFIEKFYEIKATNGNHVPLEYRNRGYGIQYRHVIQSQSLAA